MLLNIRLLVYQKRFHTFSQKAGNFGAGSLKNLRAGRLWGGFTCIRKKKEEKVESADCSIRTSSSPCLELLDSVLHNKIGSVWNYVSQRCKVFLLLMQ